MGQTTQLPQLQTTQLPHLQTTQLPQLQTTQLPHLQTTQLPAAADDTAPASADDTAPAAAGDTTPAATPFADIAPRDDSQDVVESSAEIKLGIGEGEGIAKANRSTLEEKVIAAALSRSGSP